MIHTKEGVMNKEERAGYISDCFFIARSVLAERYGVNNMSLAEQIILRDIVKECANKELNGWFAARKYVDNKIDVEEYRKERSGFAADAWEEAVRRFILTEYGYDKVCDFMQNTTDVDRQCIH